MSKEYRMYQKAIKSNNKNKLINIINNMENELYLLNLVEKYIKEYSIIDLLELSNDKINEELFLRLFKNRTRNDLLSLADMLNLKKYDMENIIIAAIKIDFNANSLIRDTGIYDTELLNYLASKNEILTLKKLYIDYGDNNILDVILSNDIMSIYTYTSFESLLPEEYKLQFMDKLMSKCNISTIIENINYISNDAIIYMYRKKKEDLTLEDVWTILENEALEECDMEFFVNKMCEIGTAEYLCMILIQNEETDSIIKLTNEQKERLEKALKETKNVECNLYYRYYKNKYKLFKDFGGVAALYIFLKANEKDFKFENIYVSIIQDIEKIIVDEYSNKQVNNVSFLFKDEEKYSVKVVKKRKKNLK